MTFSLISNLSSIDSQTRLNVTGARLNQSIQRLSSGLRINNSGDDAAGLAIANKYRSDIAVLNQGVRNANDGLSTLQVIDGGLNTISNLLDRAATLAAQSSSDTFTGDRATLQTEFSQVVAEITRQAANVGLNTDGTNAVSLTVIIGGSSDTFAADGTNNGVTIDLSSTAVDAEGLALDDADIGTDAAGAREALDAIQTAVETLGTAQGVVGAGENQLQQAIDLASSQITNFQAAESRVRDADIAAEASNMARLSVLQQAGVAALAQSNSSSQAVLALLR
ncbi:MAG TPA: flagellin [Pyrinomonadaceae bacterium]|nr:flagellin [Pyrinomonadaceae bacterium]